MGGLGVLGVGGPLGCHATGLLPPARGVSNIYIYCKPPKGLLMSRYRDDTDEKKKRDVCKI